MRWVDEAKQGPSGELERLHDLLARVLPALEEAGSNETFKAFLRFHIGDAKNELGRPEEARRWLASAAEACEPNEVFLPWILVTLAESERLVRRWSDAEFHLSRARELTGTPQDREGKSLLGYWMRTRANLDEQLGLHDRARASLDESDRLAREVADPIARRSTLEGRMSLALASDDFDGLRAMEREWPAIAVAAGSDPSHELQCAALLGVAFAEEERMAGAPTVAMAERLERALARGGLAPTLLTRLALATASHGVSLGDFRLARRALAAAPRTADSSSPAAENLRATNAERCALEMRLALDDPTEPDAAAEQGRALAAFELAFDEFIDAWTSAPIREGGIGYLHFTSRHVIGSELVRARLRLEPAERRYAAALDVLIRMQALGTLARELHAPPCSRDDITDTLLPAGGAALAYLPGKYQSYVFVVDRSGVSVHEIASIARLDEVRRRSLKRLPDALRGGSDASGDRLAESLGLLARELLPAPVQHALDGATSVQIVGMDGLGYAPFELFGLHDGRRLGERYEVSYLPSFPVGIALARAHAGDTFEFGLTLVAAPRNSAETLARHGLESIELDARELRSLTEPYGTANVIWSGADATRRALVGTRFSVLHVLAHGLFDGSRELPAGLLLADDSNGPAELWTEEIDDLRFPPLVIVSACGPARALLRRGDDGRGSLTGALIARGARTVVTSHVNQELHGTLELFHAFHRSLARGASVARALRLARIETTPTRSSDTASLVRAGWLMHAVGLADWTPASVAADPPPDTQRTADDSSMTWLWLGVAAIGMSACVVITLRIFGGRRRAPLDAA